MRNQQGKLKENVHINKEEEKGSYSQQEDRAFGKNISNGVNNITTRNNLVPIIKGKKPVYKEKEEIKLLNRTLPEESKVILSQESSSLSQIIKNGSSDNEQKEYEELLLGNPNIIKDSPRGKLSHKEKEKDFLKFGKYYIRKNEQEKKVLTTESKMEKCDREVKENPQYVVEYVRDIFLELRQSENINRPQIGYLSNFQTEISDKMRAVLVDWLIEVQQKFKLYPETLYLCINLVDRYLGIQKATKETLQLIAVACMLIACKYEEIYAPEVRDFVYITDKSYSGIEIVAMEYKILSSLDFDILSVSPYLFLRRFHFHTCESNLSFFLSQFILEFTLLEYKMICYSSSLKAAACLYIARKILKFEDTWPLNLECVTGYNKDNLRECIKEMCKILELMPNITLKSCINKFSSAKYMEVAKINIFN